MRSPRLVCLGQFTFDDVVRWDGAASMGTVGGDAIYAWLGARLWLEDVEIVAPVGTDFPEKELEALRSAGAAMDGIVRRSLPTIRSWVLYEQDGRRTWVIRSKPADYYELSPRCSDIPDSYLNASAFHVAAMDMRAQAELVAYLRRPGSLIALDPQEDYISGNEEALLALVRKVDFFLPSVVELRQLAGHDDYERAATEFASLGPAMIVVKMGAEGAMVYEQISGRVFYMPPYPSSVVDETGAGDAFCGGFMAAVAHGFPAKEAAARGIVSASYAIEASGWLGLLTLTREEVDRRLEHYFGYIVGQ